MRPPVFWSYLRWSTPPQEWGDSERRQIEPGMAWAAKKGIEFIDDYRDPGISAWTGSNLTKGALGRFIADIGSDDPYLPEAGDYLGVESLDRLSRSEHIFDAAEVLNGLWRKGITLVLLGMGEIEVNREILRKQPGLEHMLLAELRRGGSESSWKSQRVREAKEARRKRSRETGKPMTGASCPAWLIYKADTDDYDLHPENSRIVRQIFEWAAQGKGGTAIAGLLNNAEIKPFRKIGPRMRRRIEAGNEPKWHPTVIRDLLSNRAVIGYVQPCKRVDGKRVSDGPEKKLYPAVIDPAQFERVQVILLGRKGGKGAGRKDGFVNLFSGLCRCQICKKGVVIRRQKGKAYLVCEMARHGSCSNRRYFPYARLEDAVLNTAGTGMGKVLHQLIPQAERPDSPIPQLENELAELRMNRRRLIERFGLGDNDAADLVDKIDAQIKIKDKALAEAREDDLIARHTESETFLTRWRIARLKLETEDRDARIEMRALIKQRVRSVLLTTEKHVIVTFEDRRLKSQVELEITAKGQKRLILDQFVRNPLSANDTLPEPAE
jgi:DNA invertase Pin-like site-specific DNA recombinase